MATSFFETNDLFPILAQNNPNAPDPMALSLQVGLMVTGAVSAAVNLHLAEHLEERPKAIEEIAMETNTHAPSLYLLLRALAGIGIFTEIDEHTHTFGNTERSRLLRSTAMADLVRLWGAGYQWDAWQNLLHTIQTGKPALEVCYGAGTTIWSYLNAHPQDRKTFQDGLTVNSGLIIPAILDAYDFSGIHHLIDVGGGQGALVISLLSRYPQLIATLFDRENIIEQAQQELAQKLQENITSRYTQVAGNFFESVPVGDCYTIKNVLMDWDDESYLRLLRTCRNAMEASGRLLVIEPVLSEATPFTKFFSLQMAMMMHAARHRTLDEHQQLFQSAGFTLTNAIPLGLEQMLLQGRIAETREENAL